MSDDLREAVARALYKADCGRDLGDSMFEGLPAWMQYDEAADAAIAAARPVIEREAWRTIDSAPKNGTIVDLWAQSMMLADRDSDEMIVAVEFRVPRAMWWRGQWVNPDGNSLELEDFSNLRFSHWMPEPLPPAAAIQGEPT